MYRSGSRRPTNMLYSGRAEGEGEMSRRFGELRQLGYVVRDIEAGMRHWIDVFDVGPWFYVDRLPVGEFRYYGEPSDPHVSIAISYSGGAQVELIQQRNEAPSMYRDFLEAGHEPCRDPGLRRADGFPSMYRDFLEAGHEGLQHVCYFPVDYDAVLARALADGYVIGQEGSSNRGPFAYLATEAHPGSVVELAAYSDKRRAQFEAIKAVCDDWDGSDPIRTVWP